MPTLQRQEGDGGESAAGRRAVGPGSAGEGSTRRARPVVLGVLLVGAVFGAHFPAIFGDFVWDDTYLLTESPLIKARDGLYRYWLTTNAPDYFPLSSTTFWLEWRMWGNHPRPYHVTNILLHALGAVALWRVLRRLRLGEPASYLGALMYGIHPVTVASVAWISERKNVLSMCLCLVSVLVYLRFEDEGRRRWYVLGLAVALSAMLAKSAVVTLPFVLLALVWWKRGGLRQKDLLRVAPFFALSLVLGLLTIWFQSHNVIGGEVVRPEGWASRIAASGWVVWFYLYKVVLPINLSMIYPRWDVDGSRLISFLPLALLAGSFLLLWRYRRSWGRGPLVGLFCFVVMLAPVVGFVTMFFMKFSLVSDHLQYPALPAAIVPVAAALSAWAFGAPGSWTLTPRRGGVVAVGVCVAALGILTWRQAGTFRDSESLWSHTIKVNDRAWAGWNNRGYEYNLRGDHDRALKDIARAIELAPRYPEAHNNRGCAYYGKHDYDRAIADFNKAVELNPRYIEAHSNLGNAYLAKRDYDTAIREYGRAVELGPGTTDAYHNRGLAYFNKGEFDRAIEDFGRAIALKPEFAEAYRNRALACAKKGYFEQAIKDASRAVELEPDKARSYSTRGSVYLEKGEFDAAIREFTRAIELDSSQADVYCSRGNAYASKGDDERAMKDYDRAIELKPDVADAYGNRGVVFAKRREFDRALADFNKAIAIKPEYAEAYGNRGNVYLDRADYVSAIRECSKAIELKPDLFDAYNNRAAAYYHLKEYDKAWADVRACRRLGGVPPAEVVRDLKQATSQTE